MLKLINKEFLVFLFFLLLSGLFWLTNVLDDSYEKEFAVPIRLSGVPKNVILTDEIDSVVKVVVRDKGYVIGSYIFDGGFRSLSLILKIVIVQKILVRFLLLIYSECLPNRCIQVRK